MNILQCTNCFTERSSNSTLDYTPRSPPLADGHDPGRGAAGQRSAETGVCRVGQKDQ